MPSVYIAGPMTGYEHYNHAAFEYWKAVFQGEGYDVETPFDGNSRVWQKHYGHAFDPRRDRCDYGDPILAEMVAEDMRVLCASDCLALLPGWEKSKGTSAEIVVAKLLGKRILCAVSGRPLSIDLNMTPTWGFAA